MKTLPTLLAVACWFLVKASPAEEIHQDSIQYFSVKPGQCIALHKGQVCYKSLAFRWHTPETGKYCLYMQEKSKPLLCWHGREKSTYTYELASRKSITFEIRPQNSETVLSKVNVKVAWVYQSSRKINSGWRLF